MSKTPDVSGVIAASKAAKAGGRGRRSPVYLWLKARHDELQAAFEENAPSWQAVADYLAEGGVLNGNGSRPTAVSVRSAWLRVRKTVAEQRAKKPPAPSSPLSPAAHQQVRPSPAPSPETEADEPRFKFPFSKTRRVDE